MSNVKLVAVAVAVQMSVMGQVWADESLAQCASSMVSRVEVSAADCQPVGDPLLQVYSQVVQTHPTVQAAVQDVQAAENRVQSVFRKAWRPNLSVTSQAGRQAYESVTLKDGESAPWLSTNKTTVRATQLITDFDRSDASEREAVANVRQSKAKLRDAQDSVLMNALNAQWGIERAKVAQLYAERAEESVKQQAAMESSMVELGKGYESTVLQAKVQLATAETRRRRAEGAVLVAAARLETAFGTEVKVPPTHLLKAKAGVLPKSLEEARAMSVANSPKVALGAARTQALTEHAALVNAQEYRPRIDLITEASQRRNVDTSTTDSPKSYGDKKVFVQFQYDFNLGGSGAYAVDAAKGDVAVSISQEVDTRRQQQEFVTVAWRNLLTAQHNRDTLANQVRISAKFFEMVTAERASGRRSLVDVLNAEVALINAMADLADTEGEVSTAQLTVLNAVGGLRLDNLELVPVAQALPRVLQ